MHMESVVTAQLELRGISCMKSLWRQRKDLRKERLSKPSGGDFLSTEDGACRVGVNRRCLGRPGDCCKIWGPCMILCHLGWQTSLRMKMVNDMYMMVRIYFFTFLCMASAQVEIKRLSAAGRAPDFKLPFSLSTASIPFETRRCKGCWIEPAVCSSWSHGVGHGWDSWNWLCWDVFHLSGFR